MEQNKFDPIQFIGFLLISAILMFWFYDNQSSIIENQQISEAENLVEETYADSNQTKNSSSNNVKIDQKKIISKVKFTHPYYDKKALENQNRLKNIQNKKNLLFCGSYFGYGFHEDGIKSSLEMIKSFNDR